MSNTIKVLLLAAIVIGLGWYFSNITTDKLTAVPFEINVDNWHCANEDCSRYTANVFVVDQDGTEATAHISYSASHVDNNWVIEGPTTDK